VSPSATVWDKFLLDGLTTQRLVNNVALDTGVLVLRDQMIPVTYNLSGLANTSWVASLRNSYGPYARAETRLVGMSAGPRIFYQAASVLSESLLSLAGIRGGLFLNNWLLATNLHSARFDTSTILAARDKLLLEHPDQPVIVRSLTPPLHAGLLSELVSEGFHLIPTRQVWLMDELSSGDWRRHSDVKRDLALETRELSSSEWVPGTSFTDADFAQAVILYDQLYRGKYPYHNPAYDEAFLRFGISTGWLKAFGLRLNGNPLSGMVGLISQGNWFATPVLGYDLHAEKQKGLYRRLMLKAFLTVEAASGQLHCSGGAGGFKQQRGARFAVEFAAMYARHLPAYRRPALRVMTDLLWRLAVPYLQNHSL